MFLNKEAFGAITSSTIMLDFISIKLTQKIGSNPKCYSGSGSIYQKPDGTLELKMIHVYKNTQESMKEFQAIAYSSVTPGKLLNDSHYFSFEATDIHGENWTSDYISIPNSSFLPATGKVIVTPIHAIKNISERPTQKDISKPEAFAIILGKYDFPYNQWEKTETSSSLSICELTINQAICKIKKRETYIEISFLGDPGVDIDLSFQIFLEAAGIGTGGLLRPVYQMINVGDESVTFITSRKIGKNNEHLPPPIPNTRPNTSESLQEFVTQYSALFKKTYCSYFGYWCRILSAFSGTLENHALVITTSIEGILKEYYMGHGKADSEFIDQTKKALPIIKELKIGERVRERILSSLGQANSVTPKNILHNLLKKNVISKNMLDTWVTSRNKAAHAALFESNDAEIQQVIDESYICLALFYSLLLNTIGYKGSTIDYTSAGWPTREKEPTSINKS